MTDDQPTSFDLLKAVLDPLRLAVLGASVGRPVSIGEIEAQTGASRREIAAAIGSLRSSGLLDGDGVVVPDVLRAIAMDLPTDKMQPEAIDGPWTPDEAEILARFFDGDRLRSVPTNITKRRLVLEHIVQVFDPGVRYHERDVNFRLQLVYSDYAAIRRYLIDEGFMDRADGSYWRIGGRYESTPTPVAEVAVAAVIPTNDASVQLREYSTSMVPYLVRAANHPQINRYMGDRFPYPYTTEAATEWIEFTLSEYPPLNYAVFSGDELVGGVGAEHLGVERTGSFEIGWWLTPSVWGSGITSAAAKALVDELFANRGAMTLWAPVMHPNAASAGVARKIGMTLDGRRRSMYLKGGVRYDQLDFVITRDQWASS